VAPRGVNPPQGLAPAPSIQQLIEKITSTAWEEESWGKNLFGLMMLQRRLEENGRKVAVQRGDSLLKR